MTFENRPVFTLQPQYVDPVETSSDDGTRDAVGYGAATPWRVQPYAQRIYKMKFLLERPEIRQLEAFFDARRGQFEGFWLPTWNGDFRLTAPVNATDASFSVEYSGFAPFFAMHPGNARVAFILRDGTILPHTITGAVANPPTEAVQFLGNSGFSCPLEALVSNLAYVRFNSDELAIQYTTDSLAEVEIEFLELPMEYAQVDAGELPVWLYEISQGSNFWRWTSYGAPIVSGSTSWSPEDITHTSIKKSTDCFDEGVNLKIGLRSASNPFYQFLSGPPPVPVHVKLYRVLLPGLAIGSPLYEADVRTVAFTQRGVVDVTLASAMGIAEARVPRVLVQTLCNWQLFETNTCCVVEASRRITAHISASSGTAIKSPGFAIGDNYLSLGRAMFGDETRLITWHTGDQIGLNAAFRANVPVGAFVKVVPGCDKSLGTCGSKFGNVTNFGGFPYVPLKNPQLTALNPPATDGGGKK